MRQRLRDWPSSLAFVAVIGSALALAGAWLAIARPLRQLPFAQPDQLVAIETLKKGEAGCSTWADLVDLRMGSVTWGLQTAPHGHIEVVLSQQVTGEFFAALGVMPYLGEPLTQRHEQSGNQQWVWFSTRVGGACWVARATCPASWFGSTQSPIGWAASCPYTIPRRRCLG